MGGPLVPDATDLGCLFRAARIITDKALLMNGLWRWCRPKIIPVQIGEHWATFED
jgi:hypothetical protein